MTTLIMPAASFAAGIIFSTVFRKTVPINFLAPFLGRASIAPAMLLASVLNTIVWVATGERSKLWIWGDL